MQPIRAHMSTTRRMVPSHVGIFPGREEEVATERYRSDRRGSEVAEDKFALLLRLLAHLVRAEGIV